MQRAVLAWISATSPIPTWTATSRHYSKPDRCVFRHGSVVAMLTKQIRNSSRAYSSSRLLAAAGSTKKQTLSRVFVQFVQLCKKRESKVFPYSLPSVGPRADPGVQAVSPQVNHAIYLAVVCHYFLPSLRLPP